MDENHPNNPEEDVTPEDLNDPEWDEIRKKTPGLEDEPAKEEPTKEEDKKEDPEPEPEPEKEEEPAKEEPAEDAPPEPEKDKEEEAPKPQRPEKYIPVAKYTSEKAKWQEEKAALEQQLAEASAAKGKEKEDAIKAYAEKHGVPEESVRDLLSLMGSDRPDAPKELDDAIEAQLAEAEQLKAEKAFEAEFTSAAVPELKKLYPNATSQQLAAARAEIEKIACTDEFLRTPLDKVVRASQDELADLFKAPRKGPESPRQAPERGTPDLSADDFKEGKTSFEELFSLPAEKQAKIIEDMDPKTYEQMSTWVQRNDPLIINRGGRQIRT